MLFVKDTEQTIVSKDNKLSYTVAKLSKLGIEGIGNKITDMYEWLEKKWPENTSTQYDKDLRNAVFRVLTSQGFVLICSDKTRTLTFDKVIELINDDTQNDFLKECYDVAIKLNPSLPHSKTDKSADDNQEGTENTDGEIASKEETDFLDLSDRTTA